MFLLQRRYARQTRHICLASRVWYRVGLSVRPGKIYSAFIPTVRPRNAHQRAGMSRGIHDVRKSARESRCATLSRGGIHTTGHGISLSILFQYPRPILDPPCGRRTGKSVLGCVSWNMLVWWLLRPLFLAIRLLPSALLGLLPASLDHRKYRHLATFAPPLPHTQEYTCKI